MVKPGDMMVTDGDDVVVVPWSRAEEVANYARATIEQDKQPAKGSIRR